MLFRLFALTLLALIATTPQAMAFCGFYVAKADTKLFNKASKVVLVRDGDRTVVTMASDYEGDPKEFAMVIPVPTVLKKEQIHITENAIIDHLDAYSAPRLVEYFDPDPCQRMEVMEMAVMSAPQMARGAANDMAGSAKALGVTIEEQYTVGEYDILILSAKQSDGLQTWLEQNGYKIPKGATDVLQSYIKQDTKFFVAKVNLEEQAKLGATYLRPISMAFESPKFMLPIRLGTVNAKDMQELFVFALTRKGRVETVNYRTVKIPSDLNVPLYVKDEFAEFYKAMFDTAAKKEANKAVFMEYAWDMGWCDPCAADPLSAKELRELGVFWIKDQPQPAPRPGGPIRPMIAPAPQAQDVFITRLHVRYNAENFPEDLRFQETSNRQNFQGRYILQHPFKGEASCSAAEDYYKALPERFEKEARTLANITGWDIANIRSKMETSGQSFDGNVPGSDTPWWEKL